MVLKSVKVRPLACFDWSIKILNLNRDHTHPSFFLYDNDSGRYGPLCMIQLICLFCIFLFPYEPDINECNENKQICVNGECRNTPGSYSCVCNHGYNLSRDGAFCRGKWSICNRGYELSKNKSPIPSLYMVDLSIGQSWHYVNGFLLHPNPSPSHAAQWG